MEKRNITAEVFGWYGAIAILAAYFLVSFGIIASDGLAFQLLNLTGGIGLTVVAQTKKDYQLVVVNAVWAVIALAALVMIFK